MKNFLVSLLLLVSTNVFADTQAWTGEEKAWLGTAVAFTVTDWATTRDLSRRYNEGYYETNPFMGRHPSTGRVDVHFISAGLAGYFLADYLDEWRLPWLRIWTTAGVYYTNRNLNLGLKVKF
jgi:hypothetical protein